ncbi:transglycosylase SLT domain-containing protein [Tsukamurella tyrosinosolvens]|uniref:transglycosylase SLT domain-containing protein n=1 Tax=Tsukamurella tyrosinosolvens TaxID=57704 RepID=UPI001E2F0E61|nr:transglycosylase SLT domain-containing protein [Tsukamurella tyrosinosolvens]
MVPPKSATATAPGTVHVQSPVPGGRDIELVPPSATAGSSGPVSGAGAIDKAAVSYDQHAVATVTDADIQAGLLAAGVNPQLLPRFTSATRIIIGGESGGSTNAVNRWDSNAWGATQADGAPHNSSRGVMQTIPSTFAAYHAPGTSTSIYNPTANIAAGWRYASDRYGVNLQTGAGLDSFMARGTGRGVGY